MYGHTCSLVEREWVSESQKHDWNFGFVASLRLPCRIHQARVSGFISLWFCLWSHLHCGDQRELKDSGPLSAQSSLSLVLVIFRHPRKFSFVWFRSEDGSLHRGWGDGERGRRSPGSPGVGVQSCPILLSSFSDHPVDSRGYYTGASDTPYLHVSCWLVARASRTVWLGS